MSEPWLPVPPPEQRITNIVEGEDVERLRVKGPGRYVVYTVELDGNERDLSAHTDPLPAFAARDQARVDMRQARRRGHVGVRDLDQPELRDLDEDDYCDACGTRWPVTSDLERCPGCGATS